MVVGGIVGVERRERFGEEMDIVMLSSHIFS